MTKTLADSMEQFYSRTNEKDIARKLLNERLGDLKFDRALDAGAGTGELTRLLADRASELVLLEKDPFHKENLGKTYPDATLIVDSVVDADIPGDFDVIFFSHVLYFLPEDQWLPTVEMLYKKLRPGGLLFVTMNADSLHWDQLMKEFYDDLAGARGMHYLPWREFQNSLRTMAGDLEVLTYKYGMFFDSHEQLAEFFGGTALWVQDAEINKKFYPRFLQFAQGIEAGDDGRFELEAEADIVVMKK